MVILKEIDTSKDVLHLVKVWYIYGEEPIVTVPSELEKLAKKLHEEKDPTADQALSLIWRECKEYLDKIGYADDRFRERRNLIFSKDVPSGVESDEKTDYSKLKNLTTLDTLHASASVSVSDNKIVSAALAHFCEDGVYEICTETAPAYRGRGYASENVTSLSDRLIRKGKTVRYLCSEKNEASKKVALSAGFVEVGKSYEYIVRRKENKNGI